MTASPLEPARVFIVEDEMMIAMMLEDIVQDLGYALAGTAMRFEEALAQAPTIAADVAILDVNLDGAVSFPVADILRNRSIPFFFASGYGVHGLTGSYQDWLVLKKPFEAREIGRALAAALATAPPG